jgi:hypothetical protein
MKLLELVQDDIKAIALLKRATRQLNLYFPDQIKPTGQRLSLRQDYLSH